MKKRILAILLAIVLCLSAAPISATAVDSTELASVIITDEQAQRQAVRAAAAAILGENPTDDITVSNEFVNDVLANVGEEPTANDISSEISKYAALFKDKIDAKAKNVADDAEYYIADDGEFFIIVDITKHPEVLGLAVLCKSSRMMLEKQNEIATASGRDCITMDYRHIVGEQALHNTVYALTKAFGGENENSPLHGYYESAKIAELNRNEQRGANYIRVVGKFLENCYNLFAKLFRELM